MTVSELIELLEEYPPDAEVRIAHQPSWPLEYSILNVAAIRDETIVYIGEGDQIGYLPGEAAYELGWR